MYYKRMNSHFSFSHHMSEANASYSKYTTLYKRRKTLVLHIGTKWRCFILWSDSGTMLHLKRRIYEARLTAYEAQLTLHEAALRAMKRSLFRLHVFLPIRAKKWSGWGDSNPRLSAPKADALTRLRYIPTIAVL